MKITIVGKPYKIKDELDSEVEALLLNDDSEPYLVYGYVAKVIKYNPKYGDNKLCKCGHTYERHFDSWDNNTPCGCKYCECREFVLNE